MEKNDKQKKLTTWLIVSAVIILGLIIGLIVSINKSAEKEKQLQVVETYFEEEKEQLKVETEQIANEIDGYTIHIQNDSLLREFGLQKEKIKNLQKELKQTKASNAKRITELKAEIKTLRKLLKHYVRQIDSLNIQNERLINENLEVKEKYESISVTAQQLEIEKENLNEVVNRASVLETYNFSFVPLDKRQRKTKRASKMKTLKFSFMIGKNITVEPGIKNIFLRIMRPDGEILTKGNTTFAYENKNIAYSLVKEIEYTGEAHNDVLYWKVEEILQLGNYQADFFVDGNRIGSYSFRVEKD